MPRPQGLRDSLEALRLDGVRRLVVSCIVADEIADTATTFMVLSRGGHETNPLLRIPIDYLGPVAGLIVPKLFITAVVTLVAMSQPRRVVIPCGVVGAAALLVPVIHNLRLLT